MTKYEIFKYINSGIDKSGNLKKENGFKKHYPEIYNEFINIHFNDEIDSLPFKQKIWHFLNDIYYIPKCKICGKNVSFLTRSGQWGYSTYCSGSCAMKDEKTKQKLNNTKSDRYGDVNYNNTDKIKETLYNKDNKFWELRKEKSLKTRYEKNEGKYFSNDSLKKIKETTLKKYGVDSYTKTEEFKNIINEKQNTIQEKQYITKCKNKSFNTSNIENEFYNFLCDFGLYAIRQYKSKLYPFSCDFYIPSIDLYIEIQGCWTHGGHPYNEKSESDKEKIYIWKNKNTNFYKNAIHTWTELDVKKRNIAHDNNLNYLEIFSNNITDCVDIFNQYLKNIILIWCTKNNLPGNSKWCSEHPIWDCNVSNHISPRNAWNDESYLIKALNNLFYIINKDEIVKKLFIKELNTCTIKNNIIISSSKRLLEIIQNRFTIAKIAPKVTAINKHVVYDIIKKSGIDISNGVYVPMAGFGGIVECIKMLNSNIDIECYDINKILCSWYGWKERDILSQKIKTDKTVICCPPFGKKTEHWKGTPKTMSDISFKEWYMLIKEYIDAPNYIIIGPEIDYTGTGSNKGFDTKGNKRNGLFSKTSGVMLWTDDMIY